MRGFRGIREFVKSMLSMEVCGGVAKLYSRMEKRLSGVRAKFNIGIRRRIEYHSLRTSLGTEKRTFSNNI